MACGRSGRLGASRLRSRRFPPRRALLGAASLALAAATSVSCGGGGGGGGPAPPIVEPPPPPSPPPESSILEFVDVTADSAISYKHGYLDPIPNDPNEFAGGVAAGDFDGDGLEDLFVVRGDIGPNLLYRNLGGNRFEDVAEQAGVAYTKSATANYRHSGPAFADLDGDGYLDLFMGALEYDPPLLFRNNGDGTFTNVTESSGIDTIAAQYTVSVAFGDYDLDGDLDMFLTHWGTAGHGGQYVDTEHLWRNDTVGRVIRFTDVSLAAGISPDIIELRPLSAYRDGDDYTFTPTFARINGDAYPDLVVTGDFRTSRHFTNNGDGTFTNATDPNVIVDRNGMGSALGDYDGDGDLDWFVTSILSVPNDNGVRRYILGNRLYNNTDSSYFVDATDAAGVSDGGWGWGACFADLDLDGDLDIYHTNGWDQPFAPSNFDVDTSRVFVSAGDGTFSEQSEGAGLADSERGYAIVCADFDNDGDVDIFQAHRGSDNAATLWRNDTPGGNYLRVKLNGRPPNTEAAGARVTADIRDTSQMREIMIGSNFTSQNPTVQIFGLGNADQVETLEVEWPDGATTRMDDVAQGQTLTIDHPNL